MKRFPITRKAFEAYLASQSEHREYTTNTACHCPLACGLPPDDIMSPKIHWSVYSNEIVRWYAGSIRQCVPLPKWAMIFVAAVDAWKQTDKDDHLRLSMPASEALKILRAVP